MANSILQTVRKAFAEVPTKEFKDFYVSLTEDQRAEYGALAEAYLAQNEQAA